MVDAAPESTYDRRGCLDRPLSEWDLSEVVLDVEQGWFAQRYTMEPSTACSEHNMREMALQGSSPLTTVE